MPESNDDFSARVASRDLVVGVVGLGYVGLPLCISFAESGFRAVGFDIDAERANALNQGQSHIGDVASERVVAAVEADRFEATSSPDGLRAADVVFICVPTPFDKAKTPDLSYVRAATNTVAAILPLLPGTFPQGIAITPDGASAYVANNGGGVCCVDSNASSVSVIDTATNTLFATLPVGASPTGVAVTPDGAFVYVTNAIDNTVSVIRTETITVAAVVPVGNLPQGIAFGTQNDPIGALIDQVEALIATGALTQEQGNGLLDKIHQASAKHDAGQTGAACNQLNGFINQVNAFIINGTLTPAQGQALIDATDAVKTNFGC